MATSWTWCYENPEPAAVKIDSLQAALDNLAASVTDYLEFTKTATKMNPLNQNVLRQKRERLRASLLVANTQAAQREGAQ